MDRAELAEIDPNPGFIGSEGTKVGEIHKKIVYNIKIEAGRLSQAGQEDFGMT